MTTNGAQEDAVVDKEKCVQYPRMVQALRYLWHWQPTARTRTIWMSVCIAAGIAAIFWICTFKIMDRDFWWHIKAGEIFLKTHRMIATDPFAYTREGLPYLATHEWLAQIVLYLIYHLGGPTGIILFRGVVATVSMGLLLMLTKTIRPVYILLGVWAVVITKGSYLERPQLFTFVFFAAFIVLAFRLLDTEYLRTQWKICMAFILLELLWVNMHGGAALMGCAIVTFVLLQIGVRALEPYKRSEHLSAVWLLLGTLALMSVTLILPPNGFGTLTYLSQLLNDKTIAFIAEWQPRTWLLYIKELWPFFVLSVWALWLGKKQWLFNGLLLLMTAYLSRQAFRHEILFVFSAVATCYYQLDRSDRMERVWTWTKERATPVAILGVIVVLVLGRIAYARSFAFERQDNLFGFGQFDLARGAYDFLDKEHITGNMFNTYGIGGYLIYRGYPDRKVFIDGRNVDYGFEYMAHAYAAGIEPDRWEELAHQYNISYAVVDYDAIREPNRLPYSSILDKEPGWAMVYLDDWVAVYLQKTTANQSLIDRLQYKFLTASRIQFDDGYLQTAAADHPEIIEELRRMQHDNLRGTKATMALAKIALHQNNIDEAKELIATARSVRPYDPEPLAILAAIYIQKQQWEQAANTYDTLMKLAGDNYPDMDRAYIATVFEKAGRNWRAWYERLGTTRIQHVQQPTGSGSITSVGPAMGVNPAADAKEFNDLGIKQAESGKLAEAEESLKTSLKINPGAADTWNNLCALYLTEKRIPDAIDACTHATQLSDDFADAHFNLALAYYYNRSLKEAEREALRAKKLGHEKEADELLLLIRKIQL